ncbi:MAG TPA: GxGYxYP domain-containing protein [Ktedonobacteraceae bacterium]
MDTSINLTDITWPEERVFPLFQIAKHLDVYNVHSAARDIQLSIATLVGLINRPQPRVYLLDREHDAFWLNEALSAIPQTFSSLTQADILYDLLTKYRSLVQGLIIYDPALSDTANIATMMAAQRNGIAVTPDQAQALQQAPYNLAILADLRVYKWSSRLQAYRWAKDNLRNGSSPRLVAGLDPNISLGIRPFLVATRAFIYWLNPLGFLPDPGAGLLSERCLMQQILQSYAPNTTGHFGWFIQEGSGVSIASHAAISVFASDYSSNMEIWGSMHTVQPALPISQLSPSAPEPDKIYVSFTMSEGDNLQYTQEGLLRLWQDKNRGSIPIGWPIPAVLLEAAPTLLDYYVRTATPADEFMAGPSGVGYMYPADWPDEELPAFLEHTGRLMKNMNLTVLEVLESNFWQDIGLSLRAIFKGSGMALIDKKVQQLYADKLKSAGVQGIVSGSGQKNVSWNMFSGVPVYQNLGIASSVDEALAMIREGADAYNGRPIFLNLYVLAWKMTPTDLKQVAEKLGARYEIVTPGKLLGMLAT